MGFVLLLGDGKEDETSEFSVPSWETWVGIKTWGLKVLCVTDEDKRNPAVVF